MSTETFAFFHGQIAYMKARGFDIHALVSPEDSVKKISDQEKIQFLE